MIVGAELELPACTVKLLFKVELCPSVLVTVTLREPVTALERILMFAVIWVDEFWMQELTVMPEPKPQVGEARKLLPDSVTIRFDFPCPPTLGLTADRTGAACEATVMVRTGGLGSVLPAESVTVKEAVYVPAVENVTAPGFCSELVAGDAPRKLHEYPEIEPLDAVPVPEKVTDWPGPITMSDAGLVIVPLGGVSVAVFEICTNFATDGTPEVLIRKIM